MGSSRHTCNCDYCVYGRTAKKELQFGGTDWEMDEEELLPYKKQSRRGKKSKACKKSKTGEECVYNTPKVVGTTYRTDQVTGKFKAVPRTIITCDRCGKHNWTTYRFYW
jgi:hypothetical protein